MSDFQPMSSPPSPQAPRPTSPSRRRKRKRKRRPWMLEKESRRQMKQFAAEASTLLKQAIPIAKTLSENASVPGLSIGLDALLTILDKIETMRTNIEGVETLKTRAAALKKLIEKWYLRPGCHQFEDVRQRTEALCATLSKAAEDAQDIKARGIIKRFFTSNSDTKKLEGLVEDVNRAIQDFVTETILIMDQNVRAIKTYLEMSFLSTYAKHAQYDSSTVRRGCLQGTRVDVLDEAYEWIAKSSAEAAKAVAANVTAAKAKEETNTAGAPGVAPDESKPDAQSAGHFLWISGLAGTGKTTMAYSLTEKCVEDDILGANYFCSRSDAECSDPNSIFVTIARQLCQFYAPYKEKVAAALAKNPDIATAGPLRQFQTLILEPLKELEGVFPVCVIIIDALDECRDEGVTSTILSILARHIQELAPFLFIVTSRPEPHITAIFERAHAESLKDSTKPLVLHNVHLRSVLDDIRLYLADGFGEIRKAFFIEDEWPSNQDLNKLAELSQGLFIFATTVLRFIRDADYSDPRTQLQALLMASVSIMHDLYREVLKLAYNNVDTLHKTNPRLRQVLGAITLAEEPLSAAALGRLLGIEEDDIRNTLARLRSVLHVPEGSDEAVRFIHPTFPEFLLDPSVVKPDAFRIIPAEHHLALFTRSLTAMGGLKRNIVGIEKPASFGREIPGLSDIVKKCIPAHLVYASRFWSVHLSRCASDALGQDICVLLNGFLMRQMLYWLEACSLLRILDGALAALETAEHTCRNSKAFASAAALLADCHRFLWTYYYCIDIAPLQVYHSALGLAPTESLVRKAYTRELNSPLVVRRGALLHWPPRRDAFTAHSGRGVYGIVFSPAGDCFVTGGGDNKLELRKTSTRTLVQSFHGHTRDVNCVAFSPNGAHVASGSNDQDVCVWQVTSGECVRTFKGHRDNVYFVAYSADGRRLLSATDQNEMKLWDTANGRCILTLDKTGNVPLQAGLSPDGGLIARGSCASLSLHDVSSATDETIDFPYKVEACTFSPDGCLVAARSEHGIRVWQCADKSLVRSIDVSERLLSRLAFSRDGTRIACGSDNGTVFLWQVASEDPPLVIPGHTVHVWDVSWSADGLQVASASDDGTVRVCDATESPAHAERHIMSQTLCAPSEPPRFALARHKGNSVLLHLPSVKVGVDHIAVAASMPEGAPALTLFADAIDAWDTALHVTEDLSKITRRSAWAVIIGQQHVDFSAGWDAIQPIRISPDGSLLAYPTSSNVVDVYNLRIGEVVTSLTGHTYNVSSIAFSPDSTLVAAGSEDSSVKVWNATTGGVVHSHQDHRYGVRALAFSSDGRLVASGSDDQSVRVFEAATGRVERVFDNHRGRVIEVVFAAGDKRVLALDDANWVYIWDMVTGTRTYEISLADVFGTRSLILSADNIDIPIEADDPAQRPFPICDYGDRTRPAYSVSTDGWVYARSSGHTTRLCWLPLEWRNLYFWDGPRFYCLDTERRVTVEFDVSRLPEYAQTWGPGV